jgi:uncharacterized protein involved in type VI secretion and phage assembly
MPEKYYYAKYRGKVTNNEDPDREGRICVRVAAVLGGKEIFWALPSVPYAAKDVGFFFLPPVDSNVWIEFEGGNLQHPIWTGCFWNKGEIPVLDNVSYKEVPSIKVIKTEKAMIKLNDLSEEGDGGVTIETNSGLKIVMNDSSIEISSSSTRSVKLTPDSVSVNDDALEVT